MHASRTPTCRLIDYSASLKFDGNVVLRKQIVAYVEGVKRKRQDGVTQRQIMSWFRGTPNEFVSAQLIELVSSGDLIIAGKSLSSHRRANGSYTYRVSK